MAINIPGVDSHSGLELCDGEMDIYLNSLRLYASNTAKALEKMKGVSAETLKDYAITVHGVKSMSEYIGAEEARKTAKQLEMMAKGGDLAGVQAQNDTFIRYVQGIVINVKNWLAENHP